MDHVRIHEPGPENRFVLDGLKDLALVLGLAGFLQTVPQEKVVGIHPQMRPSILHHKQHRPSEPGPGSLVVINRRDESRLADPFPHFLSQEIRVR